MPPKLYSSVSVDNLLDLVALAINAEQYLAVSTTQAKPFYKWS